MKKFLSQPQAESHVQLHQEDPIDAIEGEGYVDGRKPVRGGTVIIQAGDDMSKFLPGIDSDNQY